MHPSENQERDPDEDISAKIQFQACSALNPISLISVINATM